MSFLDDCREPCSLKDATGVKKLWKQKVEVLLMHSYLKQSNLNWNRSESVKIFRSRKMGAGSAMKFSKAMAVKPTQANLNFIIDDQFILATLSRH